MENGVSVSSDSYKPSDEQEYMNFLEWKNNSRVSGNVVCTITNPQKQQQRGSRGRGRAVTEEDSKVVVVVEQTDRFQI